MKISITLNNVEAEMIQKLNLMTGGSGHNAVVNALYSEFRKHFGPNHIARAAALRRAQAKAQVQLEGTEPVDDDDSDEDTDED